MNPKHGFAPGALHTVWMMVTMAGALGLACGGLIGLALGHPDVGAPFGAVLGAFAGLLVGIRVHRALERDLANPPTPPPGGWRRWDDDDDWDT